MLLRRKSTLAFARQHAARRFPDIARALDLPMAPHILDHIDAHRGARHIVLGPTQVLKTLAGQLHAMRGMLLEAGPAIWYCGTEKAYDDLADEKFNPLFDALPVLHPLLFQTAAGAPDPSKRARDRIQFDGSSFRLRSANVTLDRQSKTARTLYIDEPWTFQPGWIEDISKRRSSFDEDASWLELYMSTGSIRGAKEKGGEFTALWDSSTRHRWHVRCPHCQKLYLPRRTHLDEKTGERTAGLVYETILRPDGLPNEPAITATVRYRCPRCLSDLPDTAAARLALSGTAQKPRGLYVQENEYASISPPTFGYQFNSVAVKPWAPIAIRMVFATLARARGDLEPTKKLVMLDDADIWSESEYFTESKTYPDGGYKMLEPWDGVALDEKKRPYCFGDIDVQMDYFVLTARKWARDSQSRQHYAEKITSPGILKDRLAMCGIMPSRTFLDTRHDPQRVRRLCSLHGWRTVLGEGEKDYPHQLSINGVTVTERRIYSEPKIISPWIGTVSAGTGGNIAEFNFSKPGALGRLALLRSIPRNDGQLHWSGASDSPGWYRKEIDAYHRAKKFTATGEQYEEWQDHSHGNDHAADTECIGVIAASMADLAGAESLTSATPPTQ